MLKKYECKFRNPSYVLGQSELSAYYLKCQSNENMHLLLTLSVFKRISIYSLINKFPIFCYFFYVRIYFLLKLLRFSDFLFIYNYLLFIAFFSIALFLLRPKKLIFCFSSLSLSFTGKLAVINKRVFSHWRPSP